MWDGVVLARERHAAVDALGAHVRALGARTPLARRVESAADELLTNAFAAARGPARLRCARVCDSILVSVVDGGGTLTLPIVWQALARARRQAGRPEDRPSGRSGAGLGLYFVVHAATSTRFRIEPGRATEVTCAFAIPSPAKSW